MDVAARKMNEKLSCGTLSVDDIKADPLAAYMLLTHIRGNSKNLVEFQHSESDVEQAIVGARTQQAKQLAFELTKECEGRLSSIAEAVYNDADNPDALLAYAMFIRAGIESTMSTAVERLREAIGK